MTFAAPGLGRDADGDGTIATWEPQRVPRPLAALLDATSALNRDATSPERGAQ
jgi:hypothetical protein